MKKLLVIIDNGHGIDTKGKCSPDKSLYEWQWARDIAGKLMVELLKNGIEYYQLVPEDNDVSLKERVRRANQVALDAKKRGYECILISLHVDAAGGDGKWHNASGWSVRVSPKASAKSKILAQSLYAQAKVKKLQGNRCVPKEEYWVQNLYICNNTSCPAVLTENLFQDNKEDVKYLLSEEGKRNIVELHLQGIINYMNT